MFVEHKEVGEVKELDATSKALLRAADLIERDGWRQGLYGAEGRPMCAYGAIMAATVNNDAVGCWSLARLTGALGKTIETWNDNPLRTKAEVVSKLRAVALAG